MVQLGRKLGMCSNAEQKVAVVIFLQNCVCQKAQLAAHYGNINLMNLCVQIWYFSLCLHEPIG